MLALLSLALRRCLENLGLVCKKLRNLDSTLSSAQHVAVCFPKKEKNIEKQIYFAFPEEADASAAVSVAVVAVAAAEVSVETASALEFSGLVVAPSDSVIILSTSCNEWVANGGGVVGQSLSSEDAWFLFLIREIFPTINANPRRTLSIVGIKVANRNRNQIKL